MKNGLLCKDGIHHSKEGKIHRKDFYKTLVQKYMNEANKSKGENELRGKIQKEGFLPPEDKSERGIAYSQVEKR